MFPSWSQAWQVCLSAYLQSIYDMSGSEPSRVTYRSTLQRFFAHCNKLPDQVSRADVLAFVQSPSTSKRNPGGEVSASTRNQRLSVLVSFYRFASAYEIDGVPLYAKALPTTGLRYYKRSVAYRAMNADELDRFFAVIPDTLRGIRDRAMFLLYFLLGRRRSELYRLCWRDIEAAVIVDDNGIRRESHVYRYYGKGRSRQVRTKELPEYAWKTLCTYLERSGRLATMSPDDVIFTSVAPGKGHKGSVRGSLGANTPLNHNYINLSFRQYIAAAGLDVNRLSLHSLRHTSARMRYEAGEDIRSIQIQLDHSSIATTDAYLRVQSGTADNGAKALEKRFGHLSR